MFIVLKLCVPEKSLKNNVTGTFSEDSVTVPLSKTELRYLVIVPYSIYEYNIVSQRAGFGTECSEKCLDCEIVPSACCPHCQLFSTLIWTAPKVIFLKLSPIWAQTITYNVKSVTSLAYLYISYVCRFSLISSKMIAVECCKL